MASPPKFWQPKQAEGMKSELIVLYGVLAAALTFFYLQPTMLPPYVHLLVLAVMSILIGSKHHLLLSRATKDASGTITTEAEEQESMDEGDAYMFPVYGSGVLFSLFLVFKFIGNDWVKWLLML